VNSTATTGNTERSYSFATDDDPELIGDALPFALKLMEGLLDQVPQHRGLLFATSSGFTQYSYVWVQQPADEVELRANFLTEQPALVKVTITRSAQIPCMRQTDCGSCK
jgi:hypothetical protein